MYIGVCVCVWLLFNVSAGGLLKRFYSAPIAQNC